MSLDGGREQLRETARGLAKGLLPPAMLSLVRAAAGRLSNRGKPEWEFIRDYRGSQPGTAKGWNVAGVADAQRKKWDSFRSAVSGYGPLGVAHEARLPLRQSFAAHNTVMSFGYVLARAARAADRVSVLDWGGGVGHFYLFARALLPEVEFDYHCKEVPVLCAAGNELLPSVTFHESDATAFSRKYDLVLASGALPYAQDWRAQLAQLASVASCYVYVTRLPLVDRAASYGLLQRAYRYGYPTEYTSWVLNRAEFLDAAAESSMTLVREFLVEEGMGRVRGVPEPAEHRGFLFRMSTASE